MNKKIALVYEKNSYN